MIKKFKVIYSPTLNERFRYKVKITASDEDLDRVIHSIGPICGMPFKSLDSNYEKAFYVYGSSVDVKDMIVKSLSKIQKGEPLREEAPGGITSPAVAAPVAVKTAKKEIIRPIAPVEIPSAALNPRYIFENLYEGRFNRLVKKICENIAHSFNPKYNPLFIWGGVGLGKTHLIQAIAHKRQEVSPEGIVYVQAQDLVGAIEKFKGNPEGKSAFVESFSDVVLLLIDDIQFLSEHDFAQEVFFLIFEKLYHGERQIILTSDRHPKKLSGFADRLRDRFEWGLCTVLPKPGLDERKEIVKMKVHEEFADDGLTEEMIDFIATNATMSIREIEGILKKIKVYVELRDVPLTMELLREVVNEMNEGLTSQEMITKRSEGKIAPPPVHPDSLSRNVSVPPPPSDFPPPPPAVQCPYCGGELSYIEMYDRWYCYNCKRYAPPDIKAKMPAKPKPKKEEETSKAALEELKTLGKKPQEDMASAPQKEKGGIEIKIPPPPEGVKFVRTIPVAIFYPVNLDRYVAELPGRMMEVIYKHHLHLKFDFPLLQEYNPAKPNYTNFVAVLEELKIKVGIFIGPKGFNTEDEDKFYNTVNRVFLDHGFCMEYLSFEEIVQDFAILNVILDIANFGKQKLGYKVVRDEFEKGESNGGNNKSR